MESIHHILWVQEKSAKKVVGRLFTGKFIRFGLKTVVFGPCGQVGCGVCGQVDPPA
jgi:hypothetical protein